MKRNINSDRFILNRNVYDNEWSSHMIYNKDNVINITRHNNYNKQIYNSLFYNREYKVLSFSSNNNAKKYNHNTNNLSNEDLLKYKLCQKQKKLGENPIIGPLEVPDIENNFYYNILDWSSKNIIAIGSDNIVYIYNPINGNILDIIYSEEEEENVTYNISSIKWNESGTLLAVGTTSGSIYIYDSERYNEVMEIIYTQSNESIYSLSWEGDMISCGSTGTIFHYDINDNVNFCHYSHSHDNSKICGLAWSGNRNYLASGGNDNIVNIWDKRNISEPFNIFSKHKAAVKAIDWNKRSFNTLVTGGGNLDQNIIIWNAEDNSIKSQINTNSQVCSILWNKNISNELVSSHGYPNNEILLWSFSKYNNNIYKWAELKGHESRILYMSMNNDGTNVASISPDNTLRIWNIGGNKSIDLCRNKNTKLYKKQQIEFAKNSIIR